MLKRWLKRLRPQAEVLPSSTTPAEPATLSPLGLWMSVPELVTEFSSLGDNCEFGIVQRYCDAEPLDYFRFAWSPLHLLRQAVDSGFEGLGEPDDLELHLNLIDEYVCRSRRYGSFDYHTEIFRGQEAEDSILKREARKTAYLRRRLLSDVNSCEKVFVRKGEDSGELSDMRALAAGLRRDAPNLILWVVEADADHAPGSVEDLGDGLIQGRLAAFAPTDNAFLMDVEGWLVLCRNALELVRRLQGRPAPLPLMPAEFLVDGGDWRSCSGNILNVSGPVNGFRSMSFESDQGAVLSCHPGFEPTPGERLVFSSWIRCSDPGDVSGLFCNFRNDAKTNFRMRAGSLTPGRWTRIWASSFMPKVDPDATVHLQLDGRKGGRFDLADWRFERGHSPASSPPSVS